MHSPTSLIPSNLPKKFPIGTTYVVEGRGGEAGELQVYSRYVVLPGGRRINLGEDTQGKPVHPRRRRRLARARAGSQAPRKAPLVRAKKIASGTGTPRQRRR